MLRSVLIAGLSAVSALQAASERPPLGTRIPPGAYVEEKVNAASRAVAFGVLDRLGKCVVKANARNSMALMMAIPTTSEGQQALDQINPSLSACLGLAAEGTNLYGTVTLKLKGASLRGAVAGALYQLQFLRRSSNALRIPATVAPIIPPEQANEKNQQLVASYDFVQCLTKARPADVRKLVLSSSGSFNEDAALSRLGPFMAPCVTQGTTVKTDRNTLRLLLAESLYRWSITAAASR